MLSYNQIIGINRVCEQTFCVEELGNGQKWKNNPTQPKKQL